MPVPSPPSPLDSSFPFFANDQSNAFNGLSTNTQSPSNNKMIALGMGDSVSTIQSVNSPDSIADPTQSSLCGKTCLMILGPVAAGLVVVGLIVGAIMLRQRRRHSTITNSDGKMLLQRRYSNLTKGKDRMLDDDDLMVEMFEPPELVPSPVHHSVMEWRHNAAVIAQNPVSSSAQQTRSAMLGLSTIMEEASPNMSTRELAYTAMRRGSGKNLKLTPLKLNQGLMRSDKSPFNTPPLSPSVTSSQQGSPSLQPFPGGNGGGHSGPGPGGGGNGQQQQYLTPIIPGQKKKRKLTIPYTPQDVTRRRSLEGSW